MAELALPRPLCAHPKEDLTLAETILYVLESCCFYSGMLVGVWSDARRGVETYEAMHRELVEECMEEEVMPSLDEVSDGSSKWNR